MSEKSELPEKRCPKCGYKWTPRVASPKKCPKGHWLNTTEKKLKERER